MSRKLQLVLTIAGNPKQIVDQMRRLADEFEYNSLTGLRGSGKNAGGMAYDFTVVKPVMTSGGYTSLHAVTELLEKDNG